MRALHSSAHTSGSAGESSHSCGIPSKPRLTAEAEVALTRAVKRDLDQAHLWWKTWAGANDLKKMSYISEL